MKKYVVPEIEFLPVSSKDILVGSDTLVDGGGLYTTSEYTGEPVED